MTHMKVWTNVIRFVSMLPVHSVDEGQKRVSGCVSSIVYHKRPGSRQRRVLMCSCTRAGGRVNGPTATILSATTSASDPAGGNCGSRPGVFATFFLESKWIYW